MITATISSNGKLELTPSNELEEYALKMWYRNEGAENENADINLFIKSAPSGSQVSKAAN